MTKENTGEAFGYFLIVLFALGWIDVLWVFGIENSKDYTWWNLIQYLGNL